VVVVVYYFNWWEVREWLLGLLGFGFLVIDLLLFAFVFRKQVWVPLLEQDSAEERGQDPGDDNPKFGFHDQLEY
jgi:hypothetical protein